MLAASTDGRRQSHFVVSGDILVPWIRTSTGQHRLAVYGPQNLELTNHATLTANARTIAVLLKTHQFQH